MRRSVAWLAAACVVGMFALPRCGGCFEDPDDPKLWVKRLKASKTKDKREEALINLYRIYEINKALGEREKKYREKLKRFKKIVIPALVDVFYKKVKKKYLKPELIIARLIGFEADHPKVGALFLDIIKKYNSGDADDFGDDEVVDGLVGNAITGLSKMAARGHWTGGMLVEIRKMVDKICRKGKRKSMLDRNSFVRNSFVKAVPDFLKAKKEADKLAGILSVLAMFGQDEKAGQDAMVTIFAIRLLGDVGHVSDEVTEALVRSLLGKGRGRRYYSFAATSVSKLPADPRTKKHPAIPALLLMLKGDPWVIQMKGLKEKIKEAEKRKRKEEAKTLKETLEQLEKIYKERKNAPTCKYPSRLKYVCELFWQANVEQWGAKEPGVIPMNALMVLRELAAESAIPTMIAEYGVDAVNDRWVQAALDFAKENGQGPFKDKAIKRQGMPGVQMQKMIVPIYGKDANIRMTMLRALGKMDAASKKEEAKREILRSISFAGDPGMMLKAGEGAYLSGYDEEIFQKLLKMSTTANSFLMANFKKRQIRNFFWGKLKFGRKYECNEAGKKELDKKWDSCMKDPPEDKEEKKQYEKDANWYCFDKLRGLWVDEFRYHVKWFKKDDPKKLIHEFCKEDKEGWYQKKFKPGMTDPKKRHKLFACVEKKTGKRGEVLCNTWPKCNSKTRYLCLDAHVQLRMGFHRHVAILATEKDVDAVMAHTGDDLMKPNSRFFSKTYGLNPKDLPQKDKSPFWDADDEKWLKYLPWGEEFEKIRQAKAKETLERHLCYHRRFLRVVKICKQNVDCYVQVVKGSTARALPQEDCKQNPAARKLLPKKTTLDWRARLKALRMLAMYAKKGRDAANAIKAAVTFYPQLDQRVTRNVATEVREMILLVIDRIGDLNAHSGTLCEYPYRERKRRVIKQRLGVANLEEKIDSEREKLKRKHEVDLLETKLFQAKTKSAKQAVKDQIATQMEKVEKQLSAMKKVEKLRKRIKELMPKVEKQLAKATRDRPCFKMLKMVIEDETDRRVKGVWQINRDARNALGRLARRSGKSYRDI